MDPQNNSLYPIAVLIDQLKSDQTSRRVNSIHNLSTIAVALGHQRTRQQLIPYLQQLLDDDQQVLIALAQTIPSLFDHIGGRMHAHCLFDPLQQLCQVQDSSVRTRAVQSFKQVLSKLVKSLIQNVIIDVIRRLAANDWYAAKIGAAALTPTAIQGMTPDGQENLLGVFQQLVQNDHPQVRKAAAQNLKLLVKKVSSESRLLDMLNLISTDKQDSVRLLAVQNLLEFSEAYPNKINQNLLPILRMLLDDHSWRIRYLITENIIEFSRKFGYQHKHGLLKPQFIKFLSDQEAEVKTAACTKLDQFCLSLDPQDVINHILPILPALAREVDYVKAALASHITKLCRHVGRSATNKHLMPVILELLRDQSADIKMCLFNDLESVCQVIGAQSLAQSLMPQIRDLSEHKQWRIRKSMASLMPSLGTQLGREFFQDNLIQILFYMVESPVFSVREEVVQSMVKLIEIFGTEWVESNILNDFWRDQSSSYVRRLTVVMAIRVLARHVSRRMLTGTLTEILVRFSGDVVPNIRMNVAKSAKEVYQIVGDQGIRGSLKSVIQALVRDEDQDVKHFAEDALKVMG